jgi:hypothetical protein
MGILETARSVRLSQSIKARCSTLSCDQLRIPLHVIATPSFVGAASVHCDTRIIVKGDPGQASRTKLPVRSSNKEGQKSLWASEKPFLRHLLSVQVQWGCIIFSWLYGTDDTLMKTPVSNWKISLFAIARFRFRCRYDSSFVLQSDTGSATSSKNLRSPRSRHHS